MDSFQAPISQNIQQSYKQGEDFIMSMSRIYMGFIAVVFIFGISISHAECLHGFHKIKKISQGHGNSPTVELYASTIKKVNDTYGSDLLDNTILSGQLRYWRFQDLSTSDASERLWSMILTAFSTGDLIQMCHSPDHSAGSAYSEIGNSKTKRLNIDSIHIMKQ